MKTRLLIVIGIVIAISLTVFVIGFENFDEYKSQNNEQCASNYMVMREKIGLLQKTEFSTASSYVKELDKILKIKKTIYELNCMSNPSQWIHLGTGTEKIKNPSQIQIEGSYDVANKIVNHPIASTKNAVTAKIAAELENRGIEYKIIPFNHIQTDEGWRDPTRLCSTLVFPNGTEFFASATFHPEPLDVTGIFTDLERPNGCQKVINLPRFDQEN